MSEELAKRIEKYQPNLKLIIHDKKKKDVILLIGGMGAMTGVNFHREVLINTQVEFDMDHIDLLHIQFMTTDQTQFIFNNELESPGKQMARIITEVCPNLHMYNLHSIAPCNT